MGREDDEMNARYEEEMRLQHDLHQAEQFLMAHKYLVIPPDQVEKFISGYEIVPKAADPKTINEDDIPF